VILHITSPDMWEAAQRSGTYEPPSLAEEGFIHFSAPEQLAGVVERYYRDSSGLVVLQVEPDAVGDLRYEESHGESFPHLYGPLPAAAVTRVTPLEEELGG
jgi:uncharacterized protein (DUF952 family)